MIDSLFPFGLFPLLVTLVGGHFLFRRLGFRRRQAMLCAAISFGAILTAITELFSLSSALTVMPLTIAWSGIGIITVVLVVALPAPGGRTGPWFWRGAGWHEAGWLLVVGLLVAVVGVEAIVAPPSTYDSLTYHLPRVAHWAQNGSVAHFRTHILRQLYLNPGAEFIILNLHILTRGDRFANLVQFGAMIGSLVAVSLIAKELGSGRYGQVLAVVFAATIPMGIMQASSTQNDYVCTLWISCLVYFTLRGVRNWCDTAWVGAALGLSILTKATAYPIAAPFVVWMGITTIRRLRFRGLAMVAAVGALSLMLCAGHFYRNEKLFGSPLGPASEMPLYQPARYSVGTLASGVVRNVMIHLNTPDPWINARLDAAVRAIHTVFGLDDSDPATTYPGWRFVIARPALTDEAAPNPLHLIVALAAAIEILRRLRGKPRRYIISLMISAGLFSLMIKWQPWASRLQLPMFVLAAPIVGLVSSRIWHPVFGTLITALLVFWGFYVAIDNGTRPLIGPDRIWNLRWNQAPTIPTGQRQLGYVCGPNDTEYSLWIAAHLQCPSPRLVAVEVRNESAALPAEPTPNVVIGLTGQVLSRPPLHKLNH